MIDDCHCNLLLFSSKKQLHDTQPFCIYKGRFFIDRKTHYLMIASDITVTVLIRIDCFTIIKNVFC